MRILLLEDNTFDADLISRKIEKEIPESKVKLAKSLKEAKNFLQNNKPFNAAILDVNLPDGSGLELLLEIREKQLAMSVIVLTGYSDQELAVAAIKAGADDFVIKDDNYETKLIQALAFHRDYLSRKIKKNNQIIKVLYAEHHPADLDLTIRHFKKYAPNFKIETIRNGQTLLKRLQKYRSDEEDFNILLIDYRLPGLDGLMITKTIRQELKLNIPIVIISGQGNEEVAIRALDLGVDDYLVKRENYVYRLPSLLQNVYQRYLLEKQQKALEKSEQHYRLLADNADDVIFTLDMDLNYTYVSPSIYKLRGFTPEEVINTPIADTLSVESYAKALQELHKAIHPDPELQHISTGPISLELELLKKDKSKIWVEIKASLLKDENKIPYGVLGVTRDISEKKRAQLELYQSHVEYKMFFDDDLTGDYLSTVEGKLLNCNPAYLKILGLKSKEEALNLDLFSIYPTPNDRNYILNELRKHGKLINYEFNMLSTNGNLINVIANITGIFDERGELISLRGYLIDNTERKRAEETIANISQRLTLATKSVKQGVWDLDIKKNILIWDDRMYELYGINAEDFSGAYEAWEKSLHPDDLNFAAKAVQDAILGIKEFNQQFRVLWPNGELHYIEGNAIVQYDSEGEAIRMVGVNRDITNQKKAELELLQLSRSVEQSPASVMITDLDGNIEYVNPKYCELSGYKLEDVIGKNPKILKSGHTTEGEYKALWETLAMGNTWYGEFLNKRKDGTFFWEYASISSIKDAEGNKSHYVAVKEDITERKRLEKTQEILANISNAVLLTVNLEAFSRLIFTELRKVIDTNNFYIALYNEQTKMISTPIIADQLDDELTDFPAKNTLTGLVIKTKKSMLINEESFAELIQKREVDLLGPLSEVWIGVPLFIKGKVIGAIVIQNYKGEYKLGAKDLKILEYVAPQISLAIDRKNSIDDLRNALDKAEKSDHLKTAFMNNISHEIRTPLNGILGFAPFIIEPDVSQEEKEMYLNTLNVSGHRLMNTITDYMDISLIVSGSMEVNPKPLDLSILLQRVYDHFLSHSLKKNLELKLILPESTNNNSLNSDAELVSKILNHLVDNAIKFTEKGSIEFGYKVIYNTNSVYAEIFVKDTGQGISQDAQTFVFDAFKQENIANTRGHEGSGLGLSISKGLTKLLGGEIRLESEKNLGTSVFVMLPMETGTIPEKEKENTFKNNGKKSLTILIAEDEELNYFYFETVIKKIASKILWAKNGKEAIDIYHKHPEIDLILMDIKMPVMDGLKATKQIKSLRNDLPIIAVTAFALIGDKERILAAGCDDYISKPVDREKLMQLVRNYLPI